VVEMPVVINEFEVVPESKTAPAQQSGERKQSGEGSAKQPSEHELRRVIEQQRVRRERLRAH
jgi:hypothetical protein